MPDRPTDQPDVNPARVAGDPLLRELAALASYLDLHLGRYPISQLTTRQKELWADLVDSDCVLDALEEDPAAGPDAYRRSVRWWRDTPARPVNEEGHAHGEQAVCRGCGKVITWDADIATFLIPYTAGNPTPETFHCRGTVNPHWAPPAGSTEPDPFRYADDPVDSDSGRDGGAPGSRHREPVSYDPPNEAAMQTARHAVMAAFQPDHPERIHVAEDLLAVYEWAKLSAVPARRIDGEIGTLHAYPSPRDAAAFLDGYRAARRERAAAR